MKTKGSVKNFAFSFDVIQGKATMLGGFNNYDNYPTLVEQFDPELGKYLALLISRYIYDNIIYMEPAKTKLYYTYKVCVCTICQYL